MKKTKVVIDAGHGGKDNGANGNGLLEKKINLTVALEVEKILKANNIEVIMTRRTDVFLELHDRASISNKANADYFVSIHHNASGTGKAKGHEVIHSVTGGKSLDLAKAISKEFTAMGQAGRGSRATFSRANASGGNYYAVIRQTDAPAVITEFGFIDNKEDTSRFNSTSKLHKQAQAIANALIKLIQPVAFKETPKPVAKPKPKATPKAKAEPKEQTGKVTASALNVRAGRGTGYAVIGVLKKGEAVRIGAKVGDWYSIYYGAHGGWVNSKYIK